MKLLSIIFLLLLVGCRTVSTTDRLPNSGMVQLGDGGRKVGWITAYYTEVLLVDGQKPFRRFLYGDREGGAILLTPGHHELKIQLKDSTQGTWTPIISERSFSMDAVAGSIYSVHFEDGELILYRMPDIPDGPEKYEKMKKEPNKAPATVFSLQG